MVLYTVRCDVCKTVELYRDGEFCYVLKARKPIPVEQCTECGRVSRKEEYYVYRFCSRKCMMSFLEKYKDENYKHEWEP